MAVMLRYSSPCDESYAAFGYAHSSLNCNDRLVSLSNGLSKMEVAKRDCDAASKPLLCVHWFNSCFVHDERCALGWPWVDDPSRQCGAMLYEKLGNEEKGRTQGCLAMPIHMRSFVSHSDGQKKKTLTSTDQLRLLVPRVSYHRSSSEPCTPSNIFSPNTSYFTKKTLSGTLQDQSTKNRH